MNKLLVLLCCIPSLFFAMDEHHIPTKAEIDAGLVPQWANIAFNRNFRKTKFIRDSQGIVPNYDEYCVEYPAPDNQAVIVTLKLRFDGINPGHQFLASEESICVRPANWTNEPPGRIGKPFNPSQRNYWVSYLYAHKWTTLAIAGSIFAAYSIVKWLRNRKEHKAEN